MQVPGCNVFIFLPCLLVGWAFPNETPLFPAQILGVSNQPILPTGGSYEKEDDSHGLDTGVGCSPSIITCLCCSFIKQAKQSQVVCKVFRVRIAPNVCQCSAYHTRLYALPAMWLCSSHKNNNLQEESSFTVLVFSAYWVVLCRCWVKNMHFSSIFITVLFGKLKDVKRTLSWEDVNRMYTWKSVFLAPSVSLVSKNTSASIAQSVPWQLLGPVGRHFSHPFFSETANTKTLSLPFVMHFYFITSR